MRTEPLTRISIVTSFEAEEPAAALLERLFSTTPSIYANWEEQRSVVTVYSPERVAAARQRVPWIKRGLEELRRLGLEIGSGEIFVEKVPREDWSESWKKYFKTIEIGSKLMIKPGWSRRTPRKGQAVVVLDPGLSFGTGQHATTLFCLKEIVRLSRPRRAAPGSFLDAGCGSGILGIAAAKLGFEPVHGFDLDPLAVRVARKNCRANRVAVKILQRDLTRLAEHSRSRFDLICANVIADILISARDKLLARLAPGGTVVLAGILASEFAAVRRAYEQAGLRLIKTAIEREWQSGSFSR